MSSSLPLCLHLFLYCSTRQQQRIRIYTTTTTTTKLPLSSYQLPAAGSSIHWSTVYPSSPRGAKI